MELFVLLKFIRFSFVGAAGMGIDFGLTYLCKEKWEWHKYIANSMGFGIAVCFNYILNRYWTFSSSNPDVGKEFILFLAISLVGLFINNLFLWVLHSRIGIRFYYAKFVAVGITALWNFLCNYYITFSVAEI